jgi:hypothetical protein
LLRRRRPHSSLASPSQQRLQHERQVFFSTDMSLGKKPMKLVVQAAPLCLGTVEGGQLLVLQIPPGMPVG